MDQRLVYVVRALHGAEDGDRAVLLPGDHPLALDVDVLLVPGALLPFDHVRGLASQGGFHVAAVHPDLVERGERARHRPVSSTAGSGS